jgi:RNA polymerase sigma-70 factor (ECF subfamily)
MRLLLPTQRPEPPPPDDVALVERARTGAAAAQAELFRRHAPRLLPMLVHLLASKSDADDALQDAFLLAFRDLKKLQDAAAFGGWLRQIAVHQAHRRFRRRRLLATLGLDREPAPATLALLASPAASPETRAQLRELDAILQRLPTRQRTAWMLRHVEGYELEEVAHSCDCSLASAKRWIAAAHARIQRRLELSENDLDSDAQNDAQNDGAKVHE